jgi:hypothetical protein
MKLFLCWSGRRSQNFAGILSGWLPKVAGDKLKPKVSREIEKGVVWFDALSRDLEGSGAGLLCLTPESLTSPWMHYEAGALSGTLGKTQRPPEGPLPSQLQPIFPFLLGVEAGALTGPFAAYQSTSAASCEDSFRLIKSIASAMPKPERPTWDLRAKFDEHWPVLQTELKAISPASIDEVFEGLEALFHRKTFDEPIHDCLDQTWLARYDGARETLSKLGARQVTVRGACRPYVADVFDALIAEVKAYAMNTSVLVGLQKFPIDQQGHVEIEPVGIAEACERRSKKDQKSGRQFGGCFSGSRLGRSVSVRCGGDIRGEKETSPPEDGRTQAG